MPQVDYNWKLKLPKNYKFIIKVPYYADTLFEETPWYEEYLLQENKYKYYTASYPAEEEDVTHSHLVVAHFITKYCQSF